MPNKKVKVYVVTAPEASRGIYETWAECEAVVKGVKGARFQSVRGMETAQALLDGGISLAPGTYAFTDGDGLGGVGVVMIHQKKDAFRIDKEIATSAVRVFVGQGITGLNRPDEVRHALKRMKNILAELGGLYEALRIAEPGSSLTIVHDYKGIGAWMQGTWKRRDEIVDAVISGCELLVREREVQVTYRHQHGHQSTWAAPDAYAKWNQRADELAALGSATQRALDES
jgi:ribonuclease HI